jgi:RNA polymerase sigma factor (sigma-70 family)
MIETSSSHEDWVRAALDRYEAPLIRYAMRITGNTEQARDVVQDTFLRLCTADRARIERRLAQWLYTVCRNRALDVRRKEGRMSHLAEGQAEAIASPDPPPSAVADRNETHQLVFDVVSTLPEKQQEVFRLKFQDGMSYREISSITGSPRSTVCDTVRSTVNTIRRRLRDQLALARDV